MKLQLVLTAFTALSIALAATSCQSTTEYTLTVGDVMAFDKTMLEAKAGDTVKVTLRNTGTNPAMQHSFVVTQPGADMEVNTASIQAGADKNYIATGHPKIIVATKMVKPGESDTVEFKAPSTPGEYPFICTFPGHYPLMKGVLVVK